MISVGKKKKKLRNDSLARNMSEIENLKFWVHLLEMEIEALRSVLSEYGQDHREYIQWCRAQTIQDLKNYLVKERMNEVKISLALECILTALSELNDEEKNHVIFTILNDLERGQKVEVIDKAQAIINKKDWQDALESTFPNPSIIEIKKRI